MTTAATDRHAHERRGIIAALHPEAQRFADWAAVHAAAADWPWMVQTAQAHKVAALLAARVETCGAAEPIGAAPLAALRAVRDEAATRAVASQHTLAQLTARFGAAGVPFFVVKGSLLSQDVYRDVRLRRFFDVDIVVHAADVACAEAALRQLDYRPGGVEEILAAPPQQPAERQRAYVLARRFQAQQLLAYAWYAPSSALLAVDLHWHVAPARLHVAEAALWAETQAARVGDVDVLTFTPAATLIHLAVHATTALLSGFRLMHLCDVGWAARRYAADVDAMWALADRWRVRDHVLLVFETVERVLQIELPFAVPARAPRRVARRSIAIATAEPFLFDAPRHKRLPLARRLRPELHWSIAMRSLRRNVAVIGAVTLARLRLALFRWRRRGAAPSG
jgi:hypothetical protein